MNIDQHIISSAHWFPSPNWDLRPDKTGIDLLVIHNISLPPGNFTGQYVEDFFQNQLSIKDDPFFEEIAALKVSSHLYIRRDGQLVQFVAFDKRAWHAGVSEFEGRHGCNDFSIGIELAGTDDLPYTDAQYSQLIAVTDLLMQHYMITRKRIAGHQYIAPGRKTDPGAAFDWDRYFHGLDRINAT